MELNDSRTLLPDDGPPVEDQISGEREIMSTLTVDPTFADDAAGYVCVASNVVDDDEMIANLTVHGNLQFSRVHELDFLHIWYAALSNYVVLSTYIPLIIIF